MRKHLSHNEYDLIMVIGRTLLFNECFFSASPLIPIVHIVLLVCLKCIAPKPGCLLGPSALRLSGHFNVIWWGAKHLGVDAERSQHDTIFKGGGFVISFIKALPDSKRRQSILIYEELIQFSCSFL